MKYVLLTLVFLATACSSLDRNTASEIKRDHPLPSERSEF
jgi:hypothetical protein